ncbi:hypothetical protein C3L33_20068, partial [Rhododendron williamsianum]
MSAYCSSIRFDLSLRILSKLQFCHYLRAHYNVILKTVKVGRDLLQISTDVLDSDVGTSMVIDSGTTLAYLADELYNPLITKVLASQPNLKLHTVEQQFTCFQFTENVDDGFPAVTFGFENSLSLTIYPREYLFQIRVNSLNRRTGGVLMTKGKLKGTRGKGMMNGLRIWGLKLHMRDIQWVFELMEPSVVRVLRGEGLVLGFGEIGAEIKNVVGLLAVNEGSVFVNHDDVGSGNRLRWWFLEEVKEKEPSRENYETEGEDDVWCVGWQSSGMSKDGKEMNLLGDMVLSSKLVLYDLENQTIGWTEYNCEYGVHALKNILEGLDVLHALATSLLYENENETNGWTEENVVVCSSSVKVKDEQSGAEYLIGPHDLSSFCSRDTGWSVTLFFLLAILHNYM